MKPTSTSRFLSAFLPHAAGRAGTAGGATMALLCATWLAAPASAFGQTLDDFKTAANSEGVNLIPFPDLRRDATAIADEVQRRKDDVKSFDYDVLEKQKNNLLKQVAAKQAEIEEFQQFKKAFEAKHPDSDLRTIDEYDIKPRTSAIAELNGQITAMNESLAKAVDGFERLYQARAGLREYFDKAMSQLSDAKSNPDPYLGGGASDDDKQQWTSYIDTIMDKIKAGISDHKVQEEGAQSTKVRFETLLKKTE
jgi:hypothetical protein